ncbi:triose-phosphate isomerase [Methanococcoides burtonii]|uniref:Triosephosphate isomerase n=1 Tax=Methanococcoides burtonii (strain DSM 6242 / NBRC 107633 / OCM 468 / ACE-M) TaxID=259564 RepID=TPIS_METBU|nr:triose-phosphate isomerase [Methanococcoides burtonii]Q12UK2.1 RecName: Full=Triosephosphate isomerase; Short=TIM; Short=TPI; AltName: Full=Triose-phosphate isomerase [Methanococcoides burtonii DSM 6242]ABE52874.1 Triosephosphate isomerase [Methanococcoides burtonii DSM 6242]
MKPLIVLNLKTYLEGTGEGAVRIARACKEVGEASGIEIAIAPQFCDIYRVASQVDVPVYSQHLDGVGAGSFTGHAFAKCIKDAGAVGTLINHSECRLKLADIEASVTAAKGEGLRTIICTNNIATTAAAAALGPDYVAVEPPELIGSGIPVSKADPEVVTGSVAAVERIDPAVKVLCGAGISKGEDLKAAIELGSVGVLLASGIVKAKDPKAALEDLVSLI